MRCIVAAVWPDVLGGGDSLRTIEPASQIPWRKSHIGAAPSTESGGAARLAAAARNAIDRLDAAQSAGIDPDVFVEVGECLFWLRALADHVDAKDDLVNGLRWPRDRIAHGQIVTAPTHWQYGKNNWANGCSGPERSGTISQHLWVSRPSVANRRDRRPGRQVGTVLRCRGRGPAGGSAICGPRSLRLQSEGLIHKVVTGAGRVGLRNPGALTGGTSALRPPGLRTYGGGYPFGGLLEGVPTVTGRPPDCALCVLTTCGSGLGGETRERF